VSRRAEQWHCISVSRPPWLGQYSFAPPPDCAVKAGDRIAQLVLERIAIAEVLETAELDDTARGIGETECAARADRRRRTGHRGTEPPIPLSLCCAGGFGSTGVATLLQASDAAAGGVPEKKARTE
jgi:hypothetical protein